MFTVKRDNIEVFRGTDQECMEYIHRHSPFSIQWAVENEGYTIEPVIESVT